MPDLGRPSALADPEKLQIISEVIAAGKTRENIVEELAGHNIEANVGTISRWKKDPRVKMKVARIVEDRAIEVTRKLDSIIQGRLQHADTLSIKDLIMIRKEFGGATIGRKEVADDDVTKDAMSRLQDPEFVKAVFGEEEGISTSEAAEQEAAA